MRVGWLSWVSEKGKGVSEAGLSACGSGQGGLGGKVCVRLPETQVPSSSSGSMSEHLLCAQHGGRNQG